MTVSSTARIPRVLSIAGTDPTGGAGIQADLKSIAAHGGYGMAVVTALVAQNTRGVRETHVPPVTFLDAQLRAVSDDVQIDAVKIGMLGTVVVARAVGAWLAEIRPPVVVLDPVMVATSGDRLLDREAEAALLELLPAADLVTPNVPELAVLAGRPVARGWDEVLDQALAVAGRYGVGVLAKGGHLDGAVVRDALVDATAVPGTTAATAGPAMGAGGPVLVEVTRERVVTTSTHGTGCSLSSAVATLRAAGRGWPQAVREATDWLAGAIGRGAELGVGTGNGPVHHFAALWDRAAAGDRSPGHPRTARRAAAAPPAGTAPRDEGGDATPQEVARRWWDEVADVRAAIEEHPFVRSLGDGTLDRDAFVHYLGQDALYLRDYARALATAGALAPSADEQSFWARSAHGAIAAELALHAGFLPEGTLFSREARPETTAYVNHLLATAARADYDVLVAALLPCYWLYAHVGRLLHARSGPGHPYAAWLETYADPQFAATTRSAIEIVTTRAAAADGERRAAMRAAFVASCRHELAFFAAPLGVVARVRDGRAARPDGGSSS